MSSKVVDAKREMKEYLETRRKRKFVAFITNEPITLTFQFEDDYLRNTKEKNPTQPSTPNNPQTLQPPS